MKTTAENLLHSIRETIACTQCTGEGCMACDGSGLRRKNKAYQETVLEGAKDMMEDLRRQGVWHRFNGKIEKRLLRQAKKNPEAFYAWLLRERRISTLT